MRKGLALSFMLALVACSDADENIEPIVYEAPAAPVATSSQPAEPTGPPVYQTPTSDPYFDDRDGIFYSYVAAVSDEDRQKGMRAGNVVTFAYLGIQDGKHVLAQVTPEGRVLSQARCREPCKVITRSDGGQLGYDKGSIIGAAFADAIAGYLEIAEINTPPRPSYPPAQPQQAPSQLSISDNELSQSEIALITEWERLGAECEAAVENGDDATACDARDENIGPRLAATNVCYGKLYEPAWKSGFHRCTADSFPLN